MGLDLTFEEWIRFEQRAKEKNPSRKTKDQPRFEMEKKEKKRCICGFLLQELMIQVWNCVNISIQRNLVPILKTTENN